MKLIVRSHNVPISLALLAHSKERIDRAVRAFREHVERVVIVFEDLNGSRKGPGHACRVFVELSGKRTLMHESRERDYYLAAGEAAHRVSRQLPRMLARVRERTHERIEPPSVA